MTIRTVNCCYVGAEGFFSRSDEKSRNSIYFEIWRFANTVTGLSKYWTKIRSTFFLSLHSFVRSLSISISWCICIFFISFDLLCICMLFFVCLCIRSFLFCFIVVFFPTHSMLPMCVCCIEFQRIFRWGYELRNGTLLKNACNVFILDKNSSSRFIVWARLCIPAGKCNSCTRTWWFVFK